MRNFRNAGLLLFFLSPFWIVLAVTCLMEPRNVFDRLGFHSFIFWGLAPWQMRALRQWRNMVAES